MGPEGLECDMMHMLPVNVADEGMCCSEVDRGSRVAVAAACMDLTKPRAVLAPSAGNMLVARECMQ